MAGVSHDGMEATHENGVATTLCPLRPVDLPKQQFDGMPSSREFLSCHNSLRNCLTESPTPRLGHGSEISDHGLISSAAEILGITHGKTC